MSALSKLVAAAGAAVLALAISRHQPPLDAQPTEPVFTKDVAPILNKNCASCHRPGGLGPFSLLDYDSAKANVADIKDAVKSGYMPPWHAEGPHGTFSNDRRLTALEKATILRWIDGGAKRGDPKALPAKPVFRDGWEMGVPDAVVGMTEDFTVPASGTIEYQYFEIPTGFTEDKWVQAIEFKPGAREVVHHVIVYARAPAVAPGAAPATPATPAAAPARAPGAAPAGPARPLFVNKPQYNPTEQPRRSDTRNPPPQRMGVIIGTTAPGTNVMEFPAGTALRVRAGTVLTFQMHYTAHGHDTKDRTSVGFRWAKEAPAEEMRVGQFINGAFTLPAGKKDIAVPAELEPTEDIKIWGILPHTHLRGTGWKYTLEKPDGTSSVVLDVPRYDFNWQTYYFFTTPLDVPGGAKLKSMAWYDNSAGNTHNPDPTIDVKWGEQTWEEMQYTGFLYTISSRRLGPAK